MANADDMVIAECHELFIAGFEWMASVVPGGRAERVGGVRMVRTDLPGFNLLFAFRPPGPLRAVFESLERLYSGSKIPWSLVTIPQMKEMMMPLIHDLGLSRIRDEPGMLLDPLPPSCPSPPHGLDIRRVTSREEMHTLVRTAEVGFGAPPGMMEVLADGLADAAGGGSLQGGCYLGYYGGRPVSTSLRFTKGKMAGVFLVATLPEFRRRGFGEAMTWRAAMDGRSEGCVSSVLQSSEMGQPVYEKIGYRTFVTYELWTK